MAAKGDVELIIRAKNEATKNLDLITTAMQKLSDQQTEVSQSGERADDSIGKLGSEFQKLQTNLGNLTAMRGISGALDSAAEAMVRQRSAVEDASDSYQELRQRQQAAKTQSEQLATSVNQTAQALAAETTALSTSRSELTQANRETRTLATQQGRLERSLASTQATIIKQASSLDEARQKQSQLAAEMGRTESPTKRLQASFEAANRTLERRSTQLETTRAREAELKNEIQLNATAQATAARRVEEVAQANTRQQESTRRAKEEVRELTVALRAAERHEGQLAREVDKSSGAYERQRSNLDRAQAEYREVETAAVAARERISQNSDTTNEAAGSARRAASELATLSSRMRTIQSGRQSTGAPLGLDVGQIRDASAAIRVAGVTIRTANTEAGRTEVSVRELTAAIKATSTARSAVDGMTTAISRQESAVSGSRDSWKASEAEVKRLAIAMREAEEPTDEMAASLGRAQGQARLAKDEFIRQSDAADRMAKELRDARVGSGDLTSAQQQLRARSAAATADIERANTSLRSMGRESREAGREARSAGASAESVGRGATRGARGIRPLITQLRAMQRESRQSMSLFQRFRGELLSMGASVVGLYAVREAISGIVTAGNDLEANRNRLGVAFGDMGRAAEELEYAREVATNLRLPLNTLVTSYANLSAAARGSALEGEGARKIFEAFAQAARVNRTSNAELDGIFRALTQSISKGRVQAEELRGQLGDRLPGAIQLMADGLGVGTERLEEMLEQGELTSEALVYMASEVSGRVAPLMADALDSPQAKMVELANTWQRVKEQLAESGFLEALGDAAMALSEQLSSPEGVAAVESIGNGLVKITELIIALIPHAEAILTTIVGIGATWTAINFGSAIATLVGGLRTIWPLIKGAAIAMAGFGTAIGIVVAVLAGLSLSKWAYDNVPAFGKAMIDIKAAASGAWDAIVQHWDITYAWIKNSFTRLAAEVGTIWTGFIKRMISNVAGLFAAVGIDGLLGSMVEDAESAARDAASDQEDVEEQHQATMESIRDRYRAKRVKRERETELEIRRYMQRFAEPGNGDAPAAPSPEDRRSSNTGTTRVLPPEDPFTPGGDGKKGASAREALEKQLANRMYTIRSQLAEMSAQTETEQLEAVRLEHEKTFDLLRRLGKDRTSEEWQTVEALIAQQQELIRVKNAEDAAKEAARERREQEQELNTLLQYRNDLMRQITFHEEQGDNTAVQRLKEQLNGVTADVRDAIDAMIVFWQAAAGEGEGGAEADAAIARLQNLRNSLLETKDTVDLLSAENLGQELGGAGVSAMDDFLAKIRETGSILGSLRQVFTQFASDFLLKIAQMIAQQALFNALNAAFGGASGGFGAGVLSGVQAAINHDGGIAGSTSRSRNVSPSVFANAARYHTGGIAGLKPNEVPIIAERGEEIVTENNPRHARNQGNGQPESSGGTVNLKNVNVFNASDMLERALAEEAGERVFLNYVNSNSATLKGALGV